MIKKDKVSLREYARMCGTTDKTVRIAVKKGYIIKGYDTKGKKIIPEIANGEWGITFMERKGIRKEGLPELTQERISELNNIPVNEIILYPTDGIAEAERKGTIIKAQRELLKLKTESGELVNKAAVDKELFELGKEVRLALQAIPDRITDQLIATDRLSALKLLRESINDVLEKLSG